jgi:hypothetical protein
MRFRGSTANRENRLKQAMAAPLLSGVFKLEPSANVDGAIRADERRAA